MLYLSVLVLVFSAECVIAYLVGAVSSVIAKVI